MTPENQRSIFTNLFPTEENIPDNAKSGVCVWHGSTEMRWQRIPAG